MDRLDAMATFVAVAELEGFAPAARRLGVSPSAVTRLVAALERRLSIQLLTRTTRSVALTDAGARYLERVRRILAAVDDAETTARAERTEPTGRFVVAAPNVFGRREVAPLMSDFLARYPAVTGELTLADRLVSLVDEGVDAAVRIGVLDDSSLRVRPVGSTRRVVVASPRYLARSRALRRPADVARHAILQVTPLTPAAEWPFFRAGREERVSFRPSFVTNSADAAVEHAIRDGGLAMVLAYQVADAVEAGALSIVLEAYEPPALPIQVVWPDARIASAALRAFVDLTATTRRWTWGKDLGRSRAGTRSRG